MYGHMLSQISHIYIYEYICALLIRYEQKKVLDFFNKATNIGHLWTQVRCSVKLMDTGDFLVYTMMFILEGKPGIGAHLGAISFIWSV